MVSIVFSPAIAAQSTRENIRERVSETISNVSQARCQRVSERVTGNIARIQNNDDIFLSNLEQVINKLTEVSIKYNINIDLQIKRADKAIQEYVKLREELASKFENVKQNACNEDRQRFDGTIVEILKLHNESLSKRAELVALVRVDMINRLKSN